MSINNLLDIPGFRNWSETTTAAASRMDTRLKAGMPGRKPYMTQLQKHVFNDDRFWGDWEDEKFKGKNLIIQAATSAGKTPVSEIATLDMRDHGRKVIVLVPLKTMVRERYRQFRDDIGGRVYASSSDYLDRDYELLRGEYDVAVMVYEKLFAMLCQDNCHILDDCGLIVVDELSMLSANERGPKLEIALEKAKQKNDPPRIICLTTLDCNTEFIEKWLSIRSEAKIDDNKADLIKWPTRPVGLKEAIVTLDGQCSIKYVPGENEDTEEGVWKNSTSYEIKEKPSAAKGTSSREQACRDRLIVTILKSIYAENNQKLPKTLIYVPSKQGTKILANSLLVNPGIKDIFKPKKLSTNFEKDLNNCDDEELSTIKNMLGYGIAFHHAGMSTNLRETIENYADEIDLIVATETLMIGVNLPFDCVILSTNKVFRNDGEEKMTPQTYKNFIGRAGRLGLAHGAGRSFLIVDKDCAEKYKKNSEEPIHSAFVLPYTDREEKVAPYYLTLTNTSFAEDEMNTLDQNSLSRSCGCSNLDIQKLLGYLTKAKLVQENADGWKTQYIKTKLGTSLAPYALSLDSVCNLSNCFGVTIYEPKDSHITQFLGSLPDVESIRSDTYLLDILYIICNDRELSQGHNLDINSTNKEKNHIQTCLLKVLRDMYESGSVTLWKESKLISDFLGESPSICDNDYVKLYRTLAMYYWVKGCSNKEIRTKMNLAECTTPLLANGDLERFSEVISFHIEAASRLPELYFLTHKRDGDLGVPYSRALYNLSVRVKYGVPSDMIILANRQVHGLDRSQLLRFSHAAKSKKMEPIAYLFEAPINDLLKIMSLSTLHALRHALMDFWHNDNMELLLDKLTNAGINDDWCQALQKICSEFTLESLKSLLRMPTNGSAIAFIRFSTLEKLPDNDCWKWIYIDKESILHCMYIAYLPLAEAQTVTNIAALFPKSSIKPIDCLVVTERGNNDLFERTQTGDVPYFCRIITSQTLTLQLGDLVSFSTTASDLLYEMLHDSRGCLNTLQLQSLNYMPPEGKTEPEELKYRILLDGERDNAPEKDRLLKKLRSSSEHNLSAFEVLSWGDALEKAGTDVPTIVLLDRNQIESHYSLYEFMYKFAHDPDPFKNCLVLLRDKEELKNWTAE